MPEIVPPLTLARSIVCAASRAPAKVAIRSARRDLTYSQLACRIESVARLLMHQAGISRGDRVLVAAQNCAEYFEIVAGISAIGAAAVTVNPRLSPLELAAIVDDCDPKAGLIEPALAELIEATRGKGVPVFPAMGREYEALLADVEGGGIYDHASGEDCFAICYTSGTTGTPKGVMLSHRSRVLTIHAMAAEYGCFGPDDHFLALTPLCHGAGFAFAAAPLFFGGTVSLGHELDAGGILARLGKGDMTGTFIVPTHAKRFLQLGEDASPLLEGHKLKALISNAAAMPQAFKEGLIALFGEGLYHEAYGSTEAGIVTNIRPADQLRKDTSVGTPFPNMEIVLRDENGALVEGPGKGELFCRGPYVFDGYLNRDQQTAETIRDGWVTVGDIAQRDEEGFYSIVGRKSDLIISGGMNVYPKEIEQVAERVEGLIEGAAVGLSDPEWGEAIAYFYVARDDVDLSETLASEFRSNLAGYKRPKVIKRTASLPRSSAGKLLRKELSATHLSN